MRIDSAWLLLGSALAFVAVDRPHLERHWALYVVVPAHGASSRGERLFLDPFPDHIACELQAHDLEAEGTPAVCHSSLAMAWGGSLDRTLTTDFSGSNLLYNLYCTLRGVRSQGPAPVASRITRVRAETP